MVKKLQEKEGGITLISLVVTIVILLILAGITIATLTGDNGIIRKAQEAREQTELAGIREEIALICNEVQIEIAGKGYTSQEIADILEEKLQENDPEASVTYQDTNNTYEIDYKDHMFEVQPSGDLTSNREEVIEDVKDALENIDKDATGEDKAEQIQEELNKKDPDSSAEYNPETGNVDITHGGYEAEVDEDGNITITGPTGGTGEGGGEEPEPDPSTDIEITSNLEPVQVIERQNDVTFEVVASGEGTLNYQWYYKTEKQRTRISNYRSK